MHTNWQVLVVFSASFENAKRTKMATVLAGWANSLNMEGDIPRASFLRSGGLSILTSKMKGSVV